MLFRREIRVESLSAHRVLDKLREAGIEVYSARKTKKNEICVQVNTKDVKKVFAILRGSCYNVKEAVPRGLQIVLDWGKRSVGILAGIVLFCAVILFGESRVLKIEVTGSGSYFRDQVKEILARNGVSEFSAAPRDTSAVTAEILALPRVSFCSVGKSGGILTVTVEVSDEAPPLEPKPLLSPVTGVVEELTVVRGRALVAAGDPVEQGAAVVSERTEDGRSVVVIARVRVRYSFSSEYTASSEEEALAQAELEYGELAEIHKERTDQGWRLSGSARRTAALNLS